MLNEMSSAINDFKFMTQETLKTWPIDKLEKFLEQAKKAYKDNEEIKKLFLEYLPKQFDFCEYVYLYHNEDIKEENGENLKDEQLKLINDEMIIDMAGDFLEDTIINIAENMLENKKRIKK